MTYVHIWMCVYVVYDVNDQNYIYMHTTMHAYIVSYVHVCMYIYIYIYKIYIYICPIQQSRASYTSTLFLHTARVLTAQDTWFRSVLTHVHEVPTAQDT